MVSGSLIFILAGTLAHLVLGRWVASPWMLPDVTLIGIGLAVSRSADSITDLALLAGLLPMVITGRHSWDVGIGYAGAAALWRWVQSHWDVADRRLSLGAVAVLELGLSIWWLNRADAWSAQMWGAVPLRVASTMAGWAVVGWLSRRHSSRYA